MRAGAVLLLVIGGVGCGHAPAGPGRAPGSAVKPPGGTEKGPAGPAPAVGPGEAAVAAPPEVGPLVPFALLGGRVSGRLPADWRRQDPGERLRGRGDREALQLFIPYRETADTGDSANAVVLAFAVPADMGIREFSDRVLGASLSPGGAGGAALKDVTEGSWRLVIARGQQGATPYALLHRLGVGGGGGVDLLVAVPMLASGGNRATVERIVAQFEAASATLTLGAAAAPK